MWDAQSRAVSPAESEAQSAAGKQEKDLGKNVLAGWTSLEGREGSLLGVTSSHPTSKARSKPPCFTLELLVVHSFRRVVTDWFLSLGSP